jgi:hypothetical protein
VTRPVFLASFLALTANGCSSDSAPAGLLPDLGVSLDCSEGPSSADEISIEKNLFQAGFDVLNRARLARELHVEFNPPVMIDAIDKHGRIVTVTGFGEPRTGGQQESTRYLDSALYSQPPTSRDARLEGNLENLARAVQKCSVRKVERHSNPASIGWLYRDIARQTRGWFGQAERQAPASDTHRVHQAA